MANARKAGPGLRLAILIKGLLLLIAAVIPADMLAMLGLPREGHSVLIAYAPEVWLTLLALVFGSLIIVVSIASENTPKLIDLFIRDPRGRLYIWLIMLSSLENIYLQMFTHSSSKFVANLILINNYILMPYFQKLLVPIVVPDNVWTAMLVILGASAAGRSFEKWQVGNGKKS